MSYIEYAMENKRTDMLMSFFASNATDNPEWRKVFEAHIGKKLGKTRKEREDNIFEFTGCSREKYETHKIIVSNSKSLLNFMRNEVQALERVVERFPEWEAIKLYLETLRHALSVLEGK